MGWSESDRFINAIFMSYELPSIQLINIYKILCVFKLFSSSALKSVFTTVPSLVFSLVFWPGVHVSDNS